MQKVQTEYEYDINRIQTGRMRAVNSLHSYGRHKYLTSQWNPLEAINWSFSSICDNLCDIFRPIVS